MNKCILTAAAALVACATAAQAATLSLTATHQPTPGMTGFRTYTMTLSSDMGAISSLEAEFSGTTIHQVNPLAFSTVFQDNNALFGFVGANPLQDSQFLFHSANETLLVVPGSAVESNSILEAAFTSFDAFVTRNIAQIVAPIGQAVQYNVLAVVGGQELRTQGAFVPEPSSLALSLCGAIAALVAMRKRRTAGKF